MPSSTYDVVEVVAMQLIGSDASVIPVSTEFSFRTSDPYTVRAVFTGPHTMSTWLIGRALLSLGMHATADAPAGTGYVRVWRAEDADYTLVSRSGAQVSAL